MKHFFLSLIIFCITTFLFLNNTSANKSYEIRSILDQENKILKTSYDAVTHMYSLSIESYFENKILTPHVLTILGHAKNASLEEKRILRGTLYRELFPLYEHLRQLGVRQLHFHTPKGESFLRFHKPSENGDPLMDIRTSIKQANTDFKYVSGFEGGRIYPGFRYVFPIVHEGSHLGSVELSLSYERIVLELSKLLTCKNHVLLMKKEVASEMVFPNHKEHFSPSILSSLFEIENPKISSLSATSIESSLVKRIDALLIQKENLPKLLSSGANFSIPLIEDNNGYIANFHPIYDTSKKLAAYAITYGYLDELVAIEHKYFTLHCFGFIALLLLCIAIFLLLEQRKNTLNDKMQLETILEKTVNGVLLLDTSGTIIRINHAASNILGYLPFELYGENSHTLIHVHDDTNAHFECPILNAIHHQCTYTGEEIFCKKSGERFIAHVNVASFVEKDKTKGAVVIFRDVSEEKKNQETIEHLAYYDALTDLPNRKLFSEHLTLTLANINRTQQYAAVIFIDLDDFKTINDTKGHDVGDILLQKVALRLKQEVRISDTVARFGGDEFILLLTNLGMDEAQACEEVKHIAHKLLHTLNCPYEFHLPKISFTHQCGASMGATVFNNSEKSISDILKEADEAMYKVKQNGRNNIHIV